MTTDKTPTEVEVTPAFLLFYERFHMEDEDLSDFINRIMVEHSRDVSRNKEREQNLWYIIGIPVCILIYWGIHRLTSEWLLRGLAGVILFGGLSILGRYLFPLEE